MRANRAHLTGHHAVVTAYFVLGIEAGHLEHAWSLKRCGGTRHLAGGERATRVPAGRSGGGEGAAGVGAETRGSKLTTDGHGSALPRGVSAGGASLAGAAGQFRRVRALRDPQPRRVGAGRTTAALAAAAGW
jgi:hypothetical protein